MPECTESLQSFGWSTACDTYQDKLNFAASIQELPLLTKRMGEPGVADPDRMVPKESHDTPRLSSNYWGLREGALGCLETPLGFIDNETAGVELDSVALSLSLSSSLWFAVLRRDTSGIMRCLPTTRIEGNLGQPLHSQCRKIDRVA